MTFQSAIASTVIVIAGIKEGCFSSQLYSGIIIFNIDSYYMDLSCCKSITKSFVM